MRVFRPCLKLRRMNSTSRINYLYLHHQTESTTGYFDCLPDPAPGLADILKLIAARPLDTFLRRHALSRFAGLQAPELEKLLGEMEPEHDTAAVHSFLLELGLLVPGLSGCAALAGKKPASVAPQGSPLLYLRQSELPDAGLHAAWARIFAENIQAHKKLPSPEELAGRGLPPLFGTEELEEYARKPLRKLGEFAKTGSGEIKEALMPAADVAELALERLREAGAVAGAEQRHIASLSPIALLMPWKLDIAVKNGRNNYTLKGQANTYGRGLSLPQARASCRMEMVERFSCYLSIDNDELLDRASVTPLLKASRSKILEKGERAIDPNSFYIEAPYKDEELVWVGGVEVKRDNPGAEAQSSPVWVPLQMAALFSNCDEIDLVSAPGSTGIATGSIMEQARLAALTEILERDAEATTVYNKKRCFQLDPALVQDETLAALLYDYRALGINVQFMDMTGPLGLPCYQAFVIGPRGNIHRGHGASLSGPKALISALTETPYPYPEGGASGPMLRKLPSLGPADLPDYGRGSVKKDLALMEAALCAGGFNPVYVELTHKTLQFPVVRALLPRMRLSADFDEFTRLSPRLYQSYLDSFAE